MWQELKNRVRLLREIPIEYVMIAFNGLKLILLAAVLWVIKNDRKVKFKTNMIYFCELFRKNAQVCNCFSSLSICLHFMVCFRYKFELIKMKRNRNTLTT